ncbi:hypothetical protein [Runella limosa]|uniref:hypothetical protein n=1 Tax=Runella limosa TaxID=370978 RepID=UPI00040514CB|nr:hypothetical protein [Runella limosa]
MDFQQDFGTVDIILNSDFETRGVDAFALSLIKAEKQARRIFTFLIFQNPAFSIFDYSELRSTLATNKNLYFDGFIKGIDLILPRQLKQVYGADYDKDIRDLILFTKDRNKIFHGQVTLGGLSRNDLIDRVTHIKKWCKHLGETIKAEIGYDGFSDSYKKSQTELKLNNLNKFDTIAKYEQFLKKEMQR